MPSYRFLNAARTLVLRDDHVIAWDPVGNRPVDPQPSATVPTTQAPNRVAEPYDDRSQPRASLLGVQARIPQTPPDETQIWRDAGSPQPAAVTLQSGVQSSPSPGFSDVFRPPDFARVMAIPPGPQMVAGGSVTRGVAPMRASGLLAEVDAIDATQLDDLAKLRAAVEALLRIVRQLVGGHAPS